MDVFWNMIESAGLLGSKIYEFQDTWTGRHELEYANYTLKTLPKGLEFFHPMSPLRVAKGHGPNQYPPSRCTPPFQWGNPLSMVWEEREE